MIGRFLNADGHVNANGDLIGYNMYAYCSNNPVMNVDPSGEGLVDGLFRYILFICWLDDVCNELADMHYERNDMNKTNLDIDTIISTYDRQPENMDKYHENPNGKQGYEAKYNDKFLSPNGGHYEVIICFPEGKSPYIVDETVDPLNMGTYNYASNEADNKGEFILYLVKHAIYDVIPYYLFGNTEEDEGGFLKWVLD